ncbi:MAG: hypothetical protein CVV04_00450 [Firmicutes bacterium HGW-Firmicutes-9]|jgi:hypothetical protein|nr:MAG: hypothetical protein CVV04_00450 [Firmicutes bacterium HGW-Firmicutes-9]
MRLSAPTIIIWLLALILAALAILSKFIGIPVIGGFIKQNDFWVMTAAYGLLFLGTLFKGL